MSLTVPQMILLGHAAGVNAERAGLGRDDEAASSSTKVSVNGKIKSLDTMDSDDYARYYSDWSS